jgi:ATP phosphoribosyltransferase
MVEMLSWHNHRNHAVKVPLEAGAVGGGVLGEDGVREAERRAREGQLLRQELERGRC